MKEKSHTLLNPFLFVCLTLSWSFTWFSAKYLVGASVLMPEILASYRFLCAGFVLFLVCIVMKLPLRATKYEVKSFIIASFFGCSINLFLFYYASRYLISGFSAIIFSMVIIFNLIIGGLFGVKQSNFIKTLLLTAIGIFGLILVIASHLGLKNLTSNQNLLGIFFATLATISFSISSVYYQTRKEIKLHPISSFTYMCIIGGIWCIVMAYFHSFFGGETVLFAINWNLKEILAFLYLAIIGTAVGYLCSFTLARRIGSVKTSYSSLIIPIVSMSISCIFEGYEITYFTIIGLALIIVSEYYTLTDKKLK